MKNKLGWKIPEEINYKTEVLDRDRLNILGFAENNFYCINCPKKSPDCNSRCYREGL